MAQASPAQGDAMQSLGASAAHIARPVEIGPTPGNFAEFHDL
jgi:hypothetical protein